jgi:outer membrane protein TolC
MLTETQWKAVQAELAVLVQDADYYNLTPEYDIYGVEELNPLDQTIARLKQESRLVQALSIRMDQLRYARIGFEEIGKPDLSLVAKLNLKNADNGFGNSFVLDKPDALIGLQLGFPVENRTSRSKISQTDIQVMQLEKQIEEVALMLASAATNIYTQITELESVLELNKEQIESSQRKTEEELKLYNQGRGDLTFVIQSRDSEQAAKLIYVSNALMYHKLLLQYRALLDQLY